MRSHPGIISLAPLDRPEASLAPGEGEELVADTHGLRRFYKG
jgi:hypothetical protein